jgi:F0F1-type ATP synthase membrane subunit b/b'
MSFIVLGLAGSSIQLVPDATLLLHLAVIVVIMALLNLTLLKPINHILEERDMRTSGRLAEARKTQAVVEAHLKRYETALRDARAEGYRLIEARRAEAMDQRDNRLKSLREELQVLITREKEEIARQVEGARIALARDAGLIGKEISAHILGRPKSGVR